MWLGTDTEYTGHDSKPDKRIVKSKRKNGHYHSDEAIQKRGEVFTPDKLVGEMLDKLPPEVFADKDKTFLDNSCGNGQFLFWVMYRKMKHMMIVSHMSTGDAHKRALSAIYGVELDPKNAEECRLRILKGSVSHELRDIVDHNIICADGLDQHHDGWSKVGFYWDENLKPDPKVIDKRLEAKAKEDAKRKLAKSPAEPLTGANPQDVDKQCPPPSPPMPSAVFPISMVSTVSAADFFKQFQGKIEQGDEW